MFSDNGALNSEFKSWSEDYVLFLHITSYVYTDKDHDLFAQRGGFGFPYLAFLGDSGHVLSQVSSRSLAGFDEAAGRGRETLVLAGKAKAGDSSAATELFQLRLGMEALSFAEASAMHKELSEHIPADRQAEIDQLLVNREITEAVNKLRKEHGRGLMKALPAPAAAYFRNGKIPNNRLASYFFGAVFQHAKATKDIKLAEDALAKAEAVFSDNTRAAKALDGYRQTVTKMKSDG